ncbi:uncharacterized protein LOC118644901 [Monomorium pharaonis]|uniref:uncharacterized protein LOC118644901 n=1 Tax=Monomorium pharaonis TaxID=307658 RepID=UPI001745F7D4|nr:uncharacterized protein LOC118644901 [Monomorium pharaonis]
MSECPEGDIHWTYNECPCAIWDESHKGTSWSPDTITKALKLYAACGQKGYEEIHRQNLPYPSIRTLQSRIQGLKFKPSIFEDVFNMLKIKIQSFIPEERHAVN